MGRRDDRKRKLRRRERKEQKRRAEEAARGKGPGNLLSWARSGVLTTGVRGGWSQTINLRETKELQAASRRWKRRHPRLRA